MALIGASPIRFPAASTGVQIRGALSRPLASAREGGPGWLILRQRDHGGSMLPPGIADLLIGQQKKALNRAFFVLKSIHREAGIPHPR
ncbi:MAG: hypothetical protein EA402_14125 [Planctomycetota bacterium]|nr:MAG: hypothetical protein EA402_14125 [Planctomycetota bacterium]